MLGGIVSAKRAYQRGLSLIELIVVMSILLILALFYIPSLVGDQDKVSDREATANLGIAHQVAKSTYASRSAYISEVVVDAIERREPNFEITTSGPLTSANPNQILVEVDPLQSDQVITLCNQGETGRVFCMRADEKGLLQAVGNDASRTIARSNGVTLTDARCWLPRRNGGPIDCRPDKGSPSWLPSVPGQSDTSDDTAAPTLTTPSLTAGSGNDVVARWSTTGQVAEAECRLDAGAWTACGSLSDHTFTIPAGDHTISVRVTGPGGSDTETAAYSRTSSAGYRDVVLRDTPASYWRLGEAAGQTTVINQVPSGPNLTYQNGPLLGRPGLISSDTNSSAVFNGSNSRAYTSALVPGMSKTTSLSIEAWVRIPRLPAQGPWVKIGRAGEGGAEGATFDGFGIGVGAGGYDAPGSGLHGALEGCCFISSGYSFPSPGTYHVVHTIGPTGVSYFWVNGTLVGSNASGTRLAPTGTVSVGGYAPALGRYFAGGVDEVAVYSYELDAFKIRAHYQAGAADSSVIASWDNSQTTGTTVADTSGNGKTLTLSGGPTWATGSGPMAGRRVLALNGATHYGVTPAIDLRNRSFSVEAWVKTTANGTQRCWFVSAPSYNFQQAFHSCIRASGTLTMAFFGHDLETTNVLTPGTWYHVVMAYDAIADRSSIFLNGQSANYVVGPRDVGPLLGAAPGQTAVGAAAPPQINSWWLGELGPVTVWGDALTQAQALARYRLFVP